MPGNDATLALQTLPCSPCVGFVSALPTWVCLQIKLGFDQMRFLPPDSINGEVSTKFHSALWTSSSLFLFCPCGDRISASTLFWTNPRAMLKVQSSSSPKYVMTEYKGSWLRYRPLVFVPEVSMCLTYHYQCISTTYSLFNFHPIQRKKLIWTHYL